MSDESTRRGEGKKSIRDKFLEDDLNVSKNGLDIIRTGNGWRLR